MLGNFFMIYNTVASLNPTGAKADHVIQIRRCDWSRDHPRVRRQGAAVRQERKPEAVVERRDHLPVQAAGKYCTSQHSPQQICSSTGIM